MHRLGGWLLVVLLLASEMVRAQIDPRSMGSASSRIMQNLTFDSPGTAGPPVTLPAPVVPGGGNSLPGGNIIINPGNCWGGGWNNGWGYNSRNFYNYYGYPGGGWGYGYGSNVNLGYQQGYFQGALERENQLLREELLRRQWEQERQAANRPQDDQPPLAPKATQKERVERTRAEASLKSGMRHFQRGSYLMAAQKFELAQAIPNGSALFLAGQAYLAAGQFDRAVAAIKEGLERNPSWPTAEVDLQKLYPNRDELFAQMGSLARELKDRPNDPDLLFLLGFELFGAGEQEKARTLLDRAARLSADDAHIQPFMDFFAKVDPVAAGSKVADPKMPPSKATDIPIPDLLDRRRPEAEKRS
jgi:tetratricopeptide (TPR) repeat protein